MSLSLPYEWLSSGHSEQLWGKGHAHKRVEYARLPRLPARDGSFDWLPPLPREDYYPYKPELLR